MSVAEVGLHGSRVHARVWINKRGWAGLYVPSSTHMTFALEMEYVRSPEDLTIGLASA